jgi:hypothetical protein
MFDDCEQGSAIHEEAEFLWLRHRTRLGTFKHRVTRVAVRTFRIACGVAWSAGVYFAGEYFVAPRFVRIAHKPLATLTLANLADFEGALLLGIVALWLFLVAWVIAFGPYDTPKSAADFLHSARDAVQSSQRLREERQRSAASNSAVWALLTNVNVIRQHPWKALALWLLAVVNIATVLAVVIAAIR